MYEPHSASAAARSPRLSMSMQRVIEWDGDDIPPPLGRAVSEILRGASILGEELGAVKQERCRVCGAGRTVPNLFGECAGLLRRLSSSSSRRWPVESAG